MLILRFWRKKSYLGNGKNYSEMDEILGSPKEKNVIDGKFHFWSCDLEKTANSAFLANGKKVLSRKQ